MQHQTVMSKCFWLMLVILKELTLEAKIILITLVCNVPNYPCNNIGKNSWVKLIFTDKKMFFDYYKKFKDTKHIEPIIIAGDWINVKNDPKCFASCIINKTSQIYIEKERD